MKKETPEEAAERIVSEWYGIGEAEMQDFFIKGAKWQSEISYSEEEVDLLTKMFNLYWYENNNEHKDNLEEWELSKNGYNALTDTHLNTSFIYSI